MSRSKILAAVGAVGLAMTPLTAGADAHAVQVSLIQVATAVAATAGAPGPNGTFGTLNVRNGPFATPAAA